MTETAQPQVQVKGPIELQLPRDTRPHAVQRRDPMTRIRVKSRTNNQVIPGGYILPQGESTCVIYAPDLPIIQAMIELQPELIEQAQQALDRAILHDLKDELADITDDDARRQHLARRRSEYAGSLEGMFFFLYKRDIKPLESVTVLEENIPAPVQQQVVDQQSFLAGIIAREVAQAMAAAMPSIIAAVTGGVVSQPPQQPQQTKQR